MKRIIGRVIAVLPAIVLQVVWYLFALQFLNGLLGNHLGDILSVVFTILAIIFVAALVAKRDESSYKLLW